MVVFANGKYNLPDNLYYDRNHVYLDRENKRVGLDQIGYAYLKNPCALSVTMADTVKIGDIFAKISTEDGIVELKSPCSGKIKTRNEDALKYMEVDTYTKGYIIEFEEISELAPGLITGEQIVDWARKDLKALIKNRYIFKVVELGDSAVGKTAIKVRLTDDYFKQDLRTTFGIDFGVKELVIDYAENNDPLFSGSEKFYVKIMVWDVAGQEHYEKQRAIYYKNAQGCILVYDVTNEVSFENLQKWIDELEFNIGTRIPTLVIGNKIDMPRKVPKEKALEFVKQKGFLYAETSAKTGDGVLDAFKKLAVQMIENSKI